ncbi:MAG: hypothetical protein LBC55_00670 [Desulfovibrio sp.]|nr:hypothetical protein [Desulfovibrio sp.]
MTRIPAVLTFLVLLLAAPVSCTPVRVSMPALVLDGPALHIAGAYSGMHLTGVMDRGCMAGVGTLSLRAVNVADADKAVVAEQGKAEDGASVGKAANTTEKTEKRKTERKDETAAAGKTDKTGAKDETAAAGEKGNADAEGKSSTTGEKASGHTADGAAGVAGTEDPSAPAFACSAELDVLPDRKARVNGTLQCTSGRRMAFSLRNLGPDQGLGVARESQEGGLMVFFYHAAESEAERRLPQILAEMESLRAGAEK